VCVFLWGTCILPLITLPLVLFLWHAHFRFLSSSLLSLFSLVFTPLTFFHSLLPSGHSFPLFSQDSSQSSPVVLLLWRSSTLPVGSLYTHVWRLFKAILFSLLQVLNSGRLFQIHVLFCWKSGLCWVNCSISPPSMLRHFFLCLLKIAALKYYLN
jgi:hypothetical protein